MINTVCACGADLTAPERAAGSVLICKSCGQRVRIAAAEAIPIGAGAGDFDARLVIVSGPQGKGETIALGGVAEIDIGKENDRHIILPGTGVSRAHAKLVRLDFGPSRWKIVDTNSRNGVSVNGHKISETELNDGDTVQIGEYSLRYAVGMLEAGTAATPGTGGIRCPGCGTHYSAKTVVCTVCGVNIQTGKALITSRAMDDDDEFPANARKWIRIASWFAPLALFPIASEAFATHKPRATWIITGVTIAVSLFFLAGVIANHRQVPPELRDYMLWAGKPGAADARVQELTRRMFSKAVANGDDEDARVDRRDMEALNGAMYLAAEEHAHRVGEFHWYQLLTNTLLHAGILHLAGNLLFLLVFGLRVNELIGDAKMWIVYPLLAIFSGGVYMLAEWNQPLQPALGASGAIMGLAGMYFVFFPLHRVHMAIWLRLFPYVIFCKFFRMRGFWLLGLWLLINDVLPTVLSSLHPDRGPVDHVAHWAHLGGFISGVVIALVLLLTRQVNAHGSDIISVMLGPRAWGLIGKPATRDADQAEPHPSNPLSL